MDINKELAGLLGLCWHEFYSPRVGRQPWENCIRCGEIEWKCKNPDFTASDGKIELLRLMFAREDWIDFRDQYITVYGDAVPVDLLLDATGLLAQAAWDWLTAQKEGVV
jgi:hypothetical protein